MKKIMFNDKNKIKKLLKDFLIKENIFNNVLYNNTCELYLNENILYGYNTKYAIFYAATHIKNCDINKLIVKWMDYSLIHTIEYKTFLRYIKENNLYEKYIHSIKTNYISDFNFIAHVLWCLTKEGGNFWNNESITWMNFFEKLIKINKKNYNKK